MDRIFREAEAEHKAQVMYETFGHLDARPGEVHAGYFVFINGQHGDLCVVRSNFPTFGEGPGYFSDREDYLWELCKPGGPCEQFGIYRFDGEYRLPKRRDGRRFKGYVTRLQVYE